MNPDSQRLNQPVSTIARRDFPLLQQQWTIREALDVIRRHGIGERIIYFYVVDAEEQLVGVLPTRRLLINPETTRLADIMIPRPVKIPEDAPILEACEMFVMHKFFAFPVVDAQGRMRGVVDVSLFTDEVFDLEERRQLEAVFESIGLRVDEVRKASWLKGFRFRFPWLLATVASGTVCALLSGAFALTLSKSLVLAFFLTLVLGLGESVSVQAMTVTIQALRVKAPTRSWYWQALRREAGTALLLGLTCGAIVAGIVLAWRGAALPAVAIGSSIALSLATAGVVGLSIPSLLHALKLDPRIAAGPVTLALADLCTLGIYFNLGRLLLDG